MRKLSLAAAIAAVLLAGGCTPTKAQGENTPAPDFAVKDMQGRTLTLADYKGKVLALNFWATWCLPCREEIPDLIDAYKTLKGEGLEVLGLSLDNLPPERLREWTEKAGINYPIALATAALVEAYRPGEYVPATIIIDGKGRIRYRLVGLTDKDTLTRLFREFSR